MPEELWPPGFQQGIKFRIIYWWTGPKGQKENSFLKYLTIKNANKLFAQRLEKFTTLVYFLCFKKEVNFDSWSWSILVESSVLGPTKLLSVHKIKYSWNQLDYCQFKQ